MFFVYILECADKSLYTGYTTSLDNRLKLHNLGKASKYTRSKLPVKIVYYEEFETKSEAMSRECRIKAMKKPDKLELINTKKPGSI
jgi:putative endonuclease